MNVKLFHSLEMCRVQVAVSVKWRNKYIACAIYAEKSKQNLQSSLQRFMQSEIASQAFPNLLILLIHS